MIVFTAKKAAKYNIVRNVTEQRQCSECSFEANTRPMFQYGISEATPPIPQHNTFRTRWSEGTYCNADCWVAGLQKVFPFSVLGRDNQKRLTIKIA